MAVWLITGCSSGFGKEVAKAALTHGDKVIATSRVASKLSDLQELGATTLSLDINALSGVIESSIKGAVEIYGRIDILLNNAGYVLEAAVEEASDAEARAQLNTNFFGYVTVIKAVLPYMRAQRSGVIANMGSITGWCGFTGGGYYCASKFALVGLTESLRMEVEHLNIQATIIEPGYFRTDVLNPDKGNKISAQRRIEDLQPVMEPFREMVKAYDQNQPGDPKKGALLIVEALTGTGRCEGKKLPPRLLLGGDAVKLCMEVIERLTKDIADWKDLSSSTDLS